MAIRRNFNSIDTFAMSSMTDVIFLLLIFFMVTSTIIFPGAIDVNLPQSGEQSSEKPQTEVYITDTSEIFLVADRNDSTQVLSIPKPMTLDQLNSELSLIHQTDSTRAIALYADSTVKYARVVEVLDLAARQKLRMVLSTSAKDVRP